MPFEGACTGREPAALLRHIPPKPSGEGCEAAGEIPRLLLFMALKTNVYVDGFNLYYGCVRGTPYKWLDVAAFCARLLPKNQINRIRYFTALVTPRANDPQQRMRQEIYLRAIRTIANLTIDLGHFLASKVWMMRTDYSEKVEVLKSEEKGSDVNLASRLLQQQLRYSGNHIERFRLGFSNRARKAIPRQNCGYREPT